MAVAVSLLIVALGAGGPGPAAPAEAAERLRGERLFTGGEALVARLDGSAAALPALVTSCANCHAAPRGSGIELARAPRLSRESLVAASSRRGGPAFAYDQERFCSTIRSGIDPSHIVLRKSMPRFTLDARQCAALWTYLTGGQHDEAR